MVEIDEWIDNGFEESGLAILVSAQEVIDKENFEYWYGRFNNEIIVPLVGKMVDWEKGK